MVRHHDYPEFIEYTKRTSKNMLAESTHVACLENMETLRKSYGLNLDDLNIEEVLMKAELAGSSAATLNNYRGRLKKWLKFRGIVIDDFLTTLLASKKGERVRKIIPKDLLTREERTQALGDFELASIRAYLAALWDTGGRPSELCKMQNRHVHEDRHGFVLDLQQTKYEVRDMSVRMLDPETIAVFSDWWTLCKDENKDKPLFTNSWGNPVDVKTMGKQLRTKFNEKFDRGKGRSKASMQLYHYRKSRITYLIKERILSPIEIKLRIGHKTDSNVLEGYYAILDEMDQANS